MYLLKRISFLSFSCSCLLGLFFVTVSSAGATPLQNRGATSDKKSFIVVYKQAADLRGRAHKLRLINGQERTLTRYAAQSMTQRDDVKYVQPDRKYHVNTSTTTLNPNDPNYLQNKQWGLNGTWGINAPTAWTRSARAGNTATIVGVLDTGIDYTHPDLKANIWNNPGETGLDGFGRDKATNGVDDDGDGYVDDVHGIDVANQDADPFDDAGHGTHVAGIIGAATNNSLGIAGVNWNVQLMALKFLDHDGSGATSDAVAAIQYGLDHGARIFNESWGGNDPDQALSDAMFAAGAQGAVFLAAAGNDGTNDDFYPTYPANFGFDNLIDVASSNINGQLSYFSDYGKNSVDVAAPGEDILSTVPPSVSKGKYYDRMSGTSMAAPFVTGIVAAMRSINPNLASIDIKNILRSNAKSFSIASDKKKVFSGGIINANQILSHIVPGITNAFSWKLQRKRTRVNLSYTALNQESLQLSRVKFFLPEKVQVKSGKHFVVSLRYADSIGAHSQKIKLSRRAWTLAFPAGTQNITSIKFKTRLLGSKVSPRRIRGRRCARIVLTTTDNKNYTTRTCY